MRDKNIKRGMEKKIREESGQKGEPEKGKKQREGYN